MNTNFKKVKQCWFCTHTVIRGDDFDATVFCNHESENIKEKYGRDRNAEKCPEYNEILLNSK